jgi:hypothetical protein
MAATGRALAGMAPIGAARRQLQRWQRCGSGFLGFVFPTAIHRRADAPGCRCCETLRP